MADRLEVEQSIGVEQSIVSGNGRYQLVLQGDGNLVLYGPRGRVLGGSTWASGTDGKPATQAVLQQDGNFVLYGERGRVLGGATWASGTDGRGGTRLIMQNDGNLVLYKSDGQAVWATNTVEPPPPPPKTPYCCGIAGRDGRVKLSRTVYAFNGIEAAGKCEQIRFAVGGTGYGLSEGTCAFGYLVEPETELEKVSPGLD